MSGLVERVARAAYAATWDEPFPSDGGIEHAHAIQVARAAIEAMREPTEEMKAVVDGYGISIDDYRHMIDAALAPEAAR